MHTLQGTNWEVRRNFIDPDQTRRANEQARVLHSSQPGYIERFSPLGRSWDDNGLTVLRVILSAVPTEDTEAFRDVIDLAKTVNAAADEIAGISRDNEDQEVFLNFYEAGASTGVHRDSHTSATVAVGLSGLANAYIWDTEKNTWRRPIALHPTDALCLDNAGAPDESPLHSVDSSRDTPRISLVNATA